MQNPCKLASQCFIYCFISLVLPQAFSILSNVNITGEIIKFDEKTVTLLVKDQTEGIKKTDMSRSHQSSSSSAQKRVVVKRASIPDTFKIKIGALVNAQLTHEELKEMKVIDKPRHNKKKNYTVTQPKNKQPIVRR